MKKNNLKFKNNVKYKIFKTIQVEQETKDLINKFRKGGETYNRFILELIIKAKMKGLL